MTIHSKWSDYLAQFEEEKKIADRISVHVSDRIRTDQIKLESENGCKVYVKKRGNIKLIDITAMLARIQQRQQIRHRLPRKGSMDK